MAGHIRREGDRWRVVAEQPHLPGGQRRRRVTHVRGSRQDAERELDRLTGTWWTGSPTVAGFVDRWLDTVRPTVRPTTWHGYRDKLAHLAAVHGPVPVDRLDPPALAQLYRQLTEAGLSARTVRHVHTVCRRMLRDAQRWGAIRANPADLVDPPRVPRPELGVWTAGQVTRFLEVTRADWLGPLWRLAVTTGLRRGELCGLRWTDLDGGRLRVQRAVTYSPGSGLTVAEPKTARGRRTVSLDAQTVTVLHRHRVGQRTRMLRLGGRGGWMFCWDDGRPLRPDTVTRQFTLAGRAAGLPAIRFHDLRHTYATLALAAGVHPKVVADRLGHSSVTVTLDTYSQVLPEVETAAAERVAALLDR